MAAAQTRDGKAASAHHDMVYAAASAVDGSIRAGAAQAEQAVASNTGIAVGEVESAAGVMLNTVQTKNAAKVKQLTADYDVALSKALDAAEAKRDAQVAAAQKKYNDDWMKLPSAFATSIPPVAESAIQVAAPCWRSRGRACWRTA